jgi:hypothetical protein
MNTRSESNTNLSYEILDDSRSSKDPEIDSLLNDDDFFCDFQEDTALFGPDNLLAQELDYFENYNMKILQHFASYYKLPKSKIKKELLIHNIIEFENNPENAEIVYNRKRMWNYLTELNDDDYFSKFIVFTL